jgi:hypothetical protein
MDEQDMIKTDQMQDGQQLEEVNGDNISGSKKDGKIII